MDALLETLTSDNSCANFFDLMLFTIINVQFWLVIHQHYSKRWTNAPKQNFRKITQTWERGSIPLVNKYSELT